VVIIHNGYSDYLKWCIIQARKFNDEVILIGDKSNNRFGTLAKHAEKKDFVNDRYSEFVQYYQHMSTNGKTFELFCFERWFILLEYMTKNSLDFIFHIDSDVMLYANASELSKNFSASAMAAYHIPKQTYSNLRWFAIPHASYWSIDGLRKFCLFIIDVYKNKINELKVKWQWHATGKIRGGICDMTLLYLFYKNNKDAIINLAPCFETYTFDSNINSSENYFPDDFQMKRKLMFLKIKNVYFRDDHPYCKKTVNDSEIQMVNLHCQGKSKMLMFSYFKGKHTVLDYLLYAKFLFPFLYKRTVDTMKYKLKAKTIFNQVS
jgi:hypothetical protein